MPFARPTFAELIDRAAADIEAGLPGTDARLRRSNLAVIARVHAAAVHGLYGYLDWLARQLMVDTADADFLARYAAIWGIQRVAASFATGTVTASGSNGSVVPAGTRLVRADGTAYVSTADATVASGTAAVTVLAEVAGAAGNAETGVSLTLVLPVAGISSGAVVASPGIAQGADEESDTALRARLLARIQAPPMGGAAHDYVAWAKEVPGVTRAWCYPLELGAGTVVVRFVRDDDDSLIPSGPEVAAVQAYIDARRPVTAAVTVAAPTAVPLNLTIALTPDTVAVRDAVVAQLQDLIRREAEPGATILLSHIREAISVAAGETNHVLSVPSANVTHAAGQIATLGTVTWA